MKPTRRTNRPYARKRRSSLLDTTTPDALLAHSGRSHAAEIEQLEPRKLLFSMTITPLDILPGRDVGTVTAEFGYVIPYHTLPLPPGDDDPRFVEFIGSRVFAVRAVLTGPVGATVRFLDLYENEIMETLDLLVPEGEELNLVDANDDGMPDFNDGIGRVEFTGVDSRVNLSLLGGTIEFDDAQGVNVFVAADATEGFMDAFEAAGFGYDQDFAGNNIGLPGAVGSVIIGSPWVRDNSTATLYLLDNPSPAVQGAAFQNERQGFFAEGGQSVGNIWYHGILHGISSFTGAIDRLYVGTLYGSVNVSGDMGSLVVGSDAGHWVRDDLLFTAFFTTDSRLTVGRTLGEVHIGGKSTLDVVVQGDVNNSSLAQISSLTYREKENNTLGFDEQTSLESVLEENTDAFLQALPFGLDYFRNDSILSAEFINRNASTVRVSGRVGRFDPVSTASDVVDVYAFAVDGTREVTFQIGFGADQSPEDALARVVNEDGFTLASHEAHTGSVEFRFEPPNAGVYYLLISDLPDADFDSSVTYNAVITGLAPTTFGSYRSAASIGDFTDATAISLLAGSLGMVRAGTGVLTGDQSIASPAEYVNTEKGTAALFQMTNSFISSAASLYSLVAGTDVSTLTLSTGRHLGNAFIGLLTPDTGDILSGTFNIGGSLGVLDVGSAIAASSDGNASASSGRFTLSTGTNNAITTSEIGAILVGGHINSTNEGFILNTRAGTVIDRLIVGTNPNALQSGELVGDTPTFNLGNGSDLRYVSFTAVATAIDPDAITTLTAGQSATLVDDNGTEFVVSVVGGTPGDDTSISLLTAGVDSSEGVALGAIFGNLDSGATLSINTTTPGYLGLGLISVNVSDGSASSIVLSGIAEIDVYEVLAGPLTSFTNATQGGDVISLDVISINSIAIPNGNLGRSQTTDFGPSLIGPFLGLSINQGGGPGTPIGIPQGALASGFQSGVIFKPIHGVTQALEDFGAPFDAWLNGASIRSGDLQSVVVGGSLGDVILQNGDIINAIANADGITAEGDFDGIVGSLYSTDIQRVDVGDGLAAPGNSPFATAGIFALDDIGVVTGGQRAGLTPVINGVIAAGNLLGQLPANDSGAVSATNGLNAITIINGLIDQSTISVSNLDHFWTSAQQADGGTLDDDNGDIVSLTGINTDLFRSSLFATNIINIRLSGGAYDATDTTVRGNVGFIFADEIRNSTTNYPAQLFSNRIRATGNINSIITNNQTGDISDFTIDIQGAFTGLIQARNIVRLTLDADIAVNSIIALNDIRATSTTSGQLNLLRADGDIRTSSFRIAGPIVNVQVGQVITSTIFFSTGPDGRIGSIVANGLLSADISSSGAINRVESLNSDVLGSVVTTEADGVLETLRAARDIVVSLEIAGNVNLIDAGRNIGRATFEPGDRAFVIGGILNQILAPDGQIYSDVRASEGINTIRIGQVVAKPGNDAVSNATFRSFGRIDSVQITGDFNGDIIAESGGIGEVIITNGSFRQGNQIRAYDADIDLVRLTGGHLLGNIFAGHNLKLLEVLRGSDGFVGHVGINPNLSAGTSFNSLRNQLPPGTAPTMGIDGPRIEAGRNIERIRVEGGMYETSVVAGFSVINLFSNQGIFNDNLSGGPGTSFIVGRSIGNLNVGFLQNTIIGAGFVSLGDDNRPGGTGANADTIEFGRINNILVRGGAFNTAIVAGMTAGDDGRYGVNPSFGFSDDRVANGRSSIGNVIVRANAINTSAYADNGLGFTSAGIIRGGPGQGQAEPDQVIPLPPAGAVELAKGADVALTTNAGENFTVNFTGRGRILWDQATDRLLVFNSNLNSDLLVKVPGNKLTDFSIISNDSAQLGSAVVRADLYGDSNFYFDGNVEHAAFGRSFSTGTFGAGGNIGTMVFGRFASGAIEANHINSLIFGGDFGDRTTTGEATVHTLSMGSVTAFQDIHGLISVERDINAVNARSIDRGTIRAGRSINSITTQTLNEARISAYIDINQITVNGNMDDSFIYAGFDLGRDGDFGGTGLNADRVGDGNIQNVRVEGNFTESDIAAGIGRGADGYLGTTDDVIDEGRSTIGTVRILGSQVGSNNNSESYRIISTGSIGTVTIGGQQITQRGNFKVEALRPTSLALQVEEFRVENDAQTYTAVIPFNQEVNSSTISGALTVQEVRDDGTLIDLTENTDYTVEYDADENAVRIIFATQVTSRDLPQSPTVPGPGIYRFTLDADVLRGQTDDALLDGDGDGVALLSDDYSQDFLIGDAGDKLDSAQGTSSGGIDFYGDVNLDTILDNNRNPDGSPDTNTPFRLYGTLGDHPDRNFTTFLNGGDLDVFTLTLQAGQILKLGAFGGVATGVQRTLLAPDLTQLFVSPGDTLAPDRIVRLPSSDGEDQILIKETGTYTLVVGASLSPPGTDVPTIITNTNEVFSITPSAGATGDYNFTIEIFDDGDTGFDADNNAGDGVDVQTAPLPIAFAGTDATLNTNDDLATVTSGGFTFTLNAGPDGTKGTADDIVSGSFGSITSTRTAGPDGVFGTTDDRRVSISNASLGKPNPTGVPGEISPDIDVYHLNGGQIITPGTKITAKLRLNERGSDLGSVAPGRVQFSLFETDRTSGDIEDGATLLFAPSQFSPTGGQPGVIATDGSTTYGYDAAGDFYITFIAPGTDDTATTGTTMALYLQGVFRADYTLEIVTQGAQAVTTTAVQNVVLGIGGGTVDWLAPNGASTAFGAFATSVVGFTGRVNNMSIDSYVLNRVLSNLDTYFTDADVNVRFSTNPADFENQPFSTVFLSGSDVPTGISNNNYGVSEHSDPFNADINDEALIYIQSFAGLGNQPTVGGINDFSDQLSAAIARRVGELVGLRFTDDAPMNPIPIMGSNSVEDLGTTTSYAFLNTEQELSFIDDGISDTDFYLGAQNSVSLLDRILADRF